MTPGSSLSRRLWGISGRPLADPQIGATRLPIRAAPTTLRRAATRQGLQHTAFQRVVVQVTRSRVLIAELTVYWGRPGAAECGNDPDGPS